MTIKLPTPEWDKQLNAAIAAVANAQAELTEARLNLDRIKARLEFKCQATDCGKVYRDGELPLTHTYTTGGYDGDEVIVTNELFYLQCTCGNTQLLDGNTFQALSLGNEVTNIDASDVDLGKVSS